MLFASAQAQPLTDWQLMNLKGKVKRLKVHTYTDRSNIKWGDDTDYNFDDKGYIQSVTAYSIGESTGLKIIKKSLVYGAYENQKREIKGISGFTNRDYHEVQEWLYPTEYRSTIYAVFPSNNNKTILGRCDAEGRLIYETNKTHDMGSEEMYEYSEEGQLVCIVITTDDLFVQYTEVAQGALDAMGNPMETVYNHRDGFITTITYTYEYYE